MKIKPKYSIIVPAYREEVVMRKSLLELADALKSDDKRWDMTEVVIVTADPDSDKTAKIAEEFRGSFAFFQLLTPESKVGKGRDVRLGMIAAKGEYRIFTDADMATPPHHIPTMLDKLESGSDVVIGVRPLKKVHNTFSRRIRSRVSNLLIRVLATPGVRDTQCGFKGFSEKATYELFEPLETLHWGFDIEILVRAQKKGYKIATMEISDWFDPKIGELGLAGESDVHANLSTLTELIAISKKRFFGQYDR